MCGRLVNAIRIHELAHLFDAAITVGEHDWQPTWNAAPSQIQPAIILARDQRRLGLMRWSWPNEFAKGIHVNAIGETAHERKTFAESFSMRRCVIPATGFYEWHEVGNGRFPHYFEAEKPFGIAGLWKYIEVNGVKEARFIVLTSPACTDVLPVLHRMPSILPDNQLSAWLDPITAIPTLKDLLRLSSAMRLISWAVDQKVNKAGVDGADLIRRK